jgi:sugar O-acyltransferase (sialic acid O-acetyltransferase NeuD family)
MSSPLLVFGAGGAAREIAAFAPDCGFEPVAFVSRDDDPLRGSTLSGLPVVSAGEAGRWPSASAIAAVGSSALRRRLAALFGSLARKSATLVHPSSHVGPRVTIGAGSIVSPMCCLTCDITIAEHCYLNIGVTISHDCTLGSFVTISPNATVAGTVHLARDVFVGAGATLINGTTEKPLAVGEGATIGAGACVIGDVAAGTTVGGVPARILRQ